MPSAMSISPTMPSAALTSDRYSLAHALAVAGAVLLGVVAAVEVELLDEVVRGRRAWRWPSETLHVLGDLIDERGRDQLAVTERAARVLGADLGVLRPAPAAVGVLLPGVRHRGLRRDRGTGAPGPRSMLSTRPRDVPSSRRGLAAQDDHLVVALDHLDLVAARGRDPVAVRVIAPSPLRVQDVALRQPVGEAPREGAAHGGGLVEREPQRPQDRRARRGRAQGEPSPRAGGRRAANPGEIRCAGRARANWRELIWAVKSCTAAVYVWTLFVDCCVGGISSLRSGQVVPARWSGPPGRWAAPPGSPSRPSRCVDAVVVHEALHERGEENPPLVMSMPLTGGFGCPGM